MSQYNDTLTKIAQMSFSYNHLLSFDLLQITPNMSDKNYKTYKDKFFFMVAFVPGKQQGNSRGYDFQQGKITQKFSTREVVALAETLYQVGIGNHMNVLPYTKFSASAGTKKNLAIWVPPPTMQNIGGVQIAVRKINLSMSQDKTKHTIVLPPSDILGMAKTLTAISERALRLEFDNFQSQPFQQQNRFSGAPANQNQGFQPQQSGNAQFAPNGQQQGTQHNVVGQPNNPYTGPNR